MHPLLSGLCELLAPATCAGCDLPYENSAQPFCDACSPLIEPAPPSLQPPHELAAAFVYAGPIADALRRFKYAGRTELAPALGRLLIEHALAYASCIDCLVPVPLHPQKLRERGYNPAALLAKPSARALGMPLHVRLLERQRATRTQAGLGRNARQDNVRGAFTAKRSVTPTRILLIDDVRTTGATLREAARELRDHGHQVVTLALAFAPE